MSGRRIPIHRSLVKEQQLFGCDRLMLLALTMVAVMLIVPAGIFVGRTMNMLVGIGLFVVGSGVLAWMGKTDPMMRQVYFRSVGYREVYRAVSRWDRIEPERKSWR